jgi:hypothetical protein
LVLRFDQRSRASRKGQRSAAGFGRGDEKGGTRYRAAGGNTGIGPGNDRSGDRAIWRACCCCGKHDNALVTRRNPTRNDNGGRARRTVSCDASPSTAGSRDDVSAARSRADGTDITVDANRLGASGYARAITDRCNDSSNHAAGGAARLWRRAQCADADRRARDQG